MVDAELRLVTVFFNGCIYNYQQLREELQNYGYRFFSRSDTEVIAKAYHRWGHQLRRTLLRHVRVRRFRMQDSGRLILGRDRLGIKPMYLSQTVPGRLRVRLVAAGSCLAGRGYRHLDRSGGAEPLHDLPRGGPGPDDHPDRRPQAAPRRRSAPSIRTASSSDLHLLVAGARQ